MSPFTGVFEGLEIDEYKGRFYVVRVIALMDRVSRKFWVRDKEERRICFLNRRVAEWFCETAMQKGLDPAIEEAAARFRITEEVKPDDTRQFPS